MYFPWTIYQTAGPGIIRYNEFPLLCKQSSQHPYKSAADTDSSIWCFLHDSLSQLPPRPLQWRQIQNLFFSFTLQNDHRRKYPSLHPLKAKVLLLYLSRPILTLSSGRWSLSRSFARRAECKNSLKYFDFGMGYCGPQFLCPPWRRVGEVEVWLHSFSMLTLGTIL